MVREICVDSDVLVDLLHNKEIALAVLHSLDANFHTTVITLFELWSGRDGNEDLFSLFQQMEIHTFDSDAAMIAGDIRKKLRAEGAEVDIRDTSIASVCIRSKLELLTFNFKHFERMKKFGLQLVRV